MGHYRCDMVSHAQDTANTKRKERARKQMAARIKAAIKEEGVEFVLADILNDPVTATIRFRS